MSSLFNSNFSLPKTVKILFLIHFGIFIPDVISANAGAYGGQGLFTYWFSLVDKKVIEDFQLWRLISYILVHNNRSILHILFNMVFLWFLSSFVIPVIGEKKFLFIYLAGGLFAGAFTLIFGAVIPAINDSPVVGVSGSLAAIFIFYATMFPNNQISLWGVIQLKAKWLAWFMVGVDLLFITANDGIAHTTHLSGALYGYLYFQFTNSKFSLMNRFRSIKTELQTKKEKTSREKIDRILKKISRDGIDSLTRNERVTLDGVKKRKNISNQGKESLMIKDDPEFNVDDILKKISEHGIDSLTGAEKKKLKKASDLKKKQKEKILDFEDFKKRSKGKDK